MLEGVFLWLLVEFGLTAVTAALLLGAAWRVAVSRASPEVPARLARGGALLLALIAIVSAALQWTMGRDWVHFQWSLACPLLALFFVSGAFLHAPESNAVSRGSNGVRDRKCSAWWFPAAAVLLALLSIVMLIAFPRPVPAHRMSPGPFVGMLQIAAYGLGLAELPPVLAVLQPSDEARGMGSLTRDLSVPFSILTLAARLILGYVTIALTLRVIPRTPIRGALVFVAPMLVTAATFSLWQPPSNGYWEFQPVDVRAFGPTLVGAGCALLALAVLQGRDRRSARDPGTLAASDPVRGDSKSVAL